MKLRMIMNFNRQHFQKAHNTKAYQDKIYEQLQDDLMRDKILNGELERHDCDDKAVYQLLKLLKQPDHIKNII